AEKTGYPVEMLDLELDLEADLGIDTVKQAELFATIRTHYGIPRREDLRLSDYNTLTKVIGFMTEALEAKVVLTEPQAAAETVVVEQPGRLEMLLETPTEQTIRRRVTIPVMRPRLDLCSPSKVTLDSSSRVIIVADSGKVGDALARKLRARKAQVLLVPVKDQPELTAKAVEFASQGAVTGVYYLCGLDAAPALDELTQQEWETQINKHGLSLFQLVKAMNGEPFLVSATRMGGLFGTDDTVNPNPFGGAINGFTKALSRERPDTLVKVVDFDASAGAADIAAHLMTETLADPSLAEVGVRNGYRFSLGLMEQEVAETGEALPTNPVVVVSGGSGGITAPVVLDMARNLGGTYYLLGRTPLPDENDHDLVALRADRNAFKADMGRRLKEKGEKATPAAVDQKIAALERAAATMETIAAGRKAGAEVNYVICDVTRMEDCAQTIQTIVEKSGRVDVLVHAAGLERSRKVETKPDEEFIQTVAVKASGFYNLYKAMQAVQRLPKAVAFFSSVAGRFGNTGQTDYAAANDLLNKFAVALSRQDGGMRVVSIDWGAWAEVGMASRGYIPELMKRAGIELMHPAEAAPVVRKELLAGTRGEIVISGALGVMEADSANVGLDLEKANQALTEGHPIHIMLTRATGFTVEDGVILEADLDPESEPFLKDHTMNGTPLLPGVMGIEGLSTAARHIASTLASPKGSLKVSRLEDIQFKTPFKFYKNQARRVTWKARGVLENGQMVAYASLESSLARLGRDPEVTQHFSAKVYLVPVEQVLEEKFTAEIPHWNGHAKLNAEEIYTLYFHGPAFQVLEAVQKTGSVLLGKLNPNLPNFTSVEQNLSMSPVLVELCLQTAGVWEVGHTGTMALPGSIGSLSVYHNEVNGTPIYAEVTPRMQENQQMIFDARVVDAKGRVYVEMKDYATIQMPYAAETDKVGPIQKWI
ncbi:MAG: SDR family NAD(P)-dependent oxidoreductase, partial [Anaerolineae bacterium]|nr:SDR family NAD(P)-dependent oxidoreductase [Anaerolineae bacterium]